MLHSEDYDSEGATLSICDGVCLTATRDVLHAITSDHLRPSAIVLALGYSGWGPGQLEMELVGERLARSGCRTWPSSTIASLDTKWSRALARIGVSPDKLQVAGGRA